jgi:predicted TPR repeat methyltransferase
VTRGADPRDSLALQQIAERFQAGDLDGAAALAGELIDKHRHDDSERRLPAILWLGFIAQQRGDLPGARTRFAEARRIDRRNPNLLVQLGALHDRLGERAEAEHCYREAIRLEPRMATAHYNLGIVLGAKGDLAGARRAYEAAIVHQPAFPQAFLNLGNVFLHLNDAASAKECYRRAIALDGRFAAAHRALGLLAMRHQQPEPAIQCLRAAVDIDPELVDAWIDLSDALQRAGRADEALAALDAALTRAPHHEAARFKRAVLAGEQPASMPDSVVTSLFEGMASTFDEHLVGRLGYDVPARLAALLGGWMSTKQVTQGRGVSVLDLGCGTGLFGEAIHADASRIVGVDLSAAMIEAARQRGRYADLHVAPMLEFLERTSESFDLIAATDVLVYTGALEGLFALARARLAPAGRFAFSVEAPADLTEGFQLLPAARYAHSPAYVEDVAAASGFRVDQRAAATIRTEAGVPQVGFIYVLAA